LPFGGADHPDRGADRFFSAFLHLVGFDLRIRQPIPRSFAGTSDPLSSTGCVLNAMTPIQRWPFFPVGGPDAPLFPVDVNGSLLKVLSVDIDERTSDRGEPSLQEG
jgi:hypothetical protein